MPRAKRLKTIDSQLLLKIETAVAKGSVTNTAIARALGWAPSTFKNYRYGKGGSERYKASIEPIETAIKRGFNRRTDSMLSKAEDALTDLLRHDTFQERHQERRRVPHRRRQENGTYIDVIEETEVQKVVEKRRIPNAIIAMFVAVNASQTDEKKRNIAWKSIQQVAEKMPVDKGAIMKRIDELLKE